MGAFSTVQQFDKRFAWSFFGFLVGALGFGYAIYVDYFKDVRPDLIFEVQSNTNVLDLNEDIGRLEIIYNGEDVKKTNQNLRILTLKVVNQGTVDINESHYDSSTPFGFTILGGKIAERPEIIESSNDYLNRSLSLSLDSSGYVTFSKIQFDRGQYFIIKILTITPMDTIPRIRTSGKISGIINSIPVKILTQQAEQEKSFWQKLISGDFLIHFTRFWFYLLVLMLFSLSIILPFSLISERSEKKRRRKKVKKFEATSKNKLGELSDLLAHYYILNGNEFLRQLSQTLKNKDRIKLLLAIASNDKSRIKILNKLGEVEHERHQLRHHTHGMTQLSKAIETLERLGVITVENEKFIVDEKFRLALGELYNFVQTH